jgi:hypothetical protein
MKVLILLPVAAFAIFYVSLRRHSVDVRRAILAAMTFLGSCVVLSTEILSVPRWVSRGGVAISWLVICGIGLVVLSSTKDVDALKYEPEIGGEREKLDFVTRVLLCVCALMAALVAVTAVLAPPSGIDGMVYHMPRVAMWISNHNVAFFPTANYTQLIYGAFAEYSMLHTMELWGSDRFVNLVQFFSFLGSAVAVSYIVKKMGGGAWTQALGALVCISIPEGVLEASGPMTTYSNAFWIASTVAFLLAWNEDASWLNTVCIGLGAGLAIFTKGTTYIILPFLVLACWWVASRQSKILFLKRSLVFLALIFAINGPQYFRNYEFIGKPLGLPMDYGAVDFRIRDIGIRSTAASILRNISLHTGTPSASLNAKEEKVYRAMMRSFGVDADDGRQVIWDEPFIVNHLSFQELLAGNPMHLLLLVVALGLIFAKAGDPSNRVVLWYSTGLITAFVAFSALLKWQRWSSRYFLPFFVLGAAITAVALSKYVSRRWVTAIAAVLVAWGLLNASINRFRSLVPFSHWETAYKPRPIMYFSYDNEYMAPSYIAAADEVNKSQCANVGIDSYTPLSDHDIRRSPDSFFTYPILALIHADGRTRAAWFSGVHNLSAKYAASQPHPAACAIVCLDCAKTPAKWREYGNFQDQAVFQDVVVFTNPKP